MAGLLVIGITGGVGAGKSSILTYLKKRYDATILEADSIGRVMMMPGGRTYGRIVSEYGEEILNEDKTINSKKVAEIVFNNKKGLKSINEIVHPEVVSFLSERIAAEKLEAVVSNEKTRIVCIEAALLFEGGADHLCDEIWYIYASEETRIERLKMSRGYSEKKSISIMRNQMSEEEFREKCDYCIDNDRDLPDVYRQIDERMSFIISGTPEGRDEI